MKLKPLVQALSQEFGKLTPQHQGEGHSKCILVGA